VVGVSTPLVAEVSTLKQVDCLVAEGISIRPVVFGSRGHSEKLRHHSL